MKKFLMMMALVALGVSATRCTEAPQQKKTLVAYFSATGTTRAVAEQLAELLGADLSEITPETAYTAEDLDWRDSLSRSSVEMRDKASRPAIQGTVENLGDYDKVYIGFPIWWNLAPTVINTFIEANDFTGKTLVPFATSGSSSIENASKELLETYPDYVWGEGRLLNHLDPAAIELWAK